MNTKRTALWAVTGVIGLSAIGGFAWADTQRPTESPTPAVSAPTVTGPTATSDPSQGVTTLTANTAPTANTANTSAAQVGPNDVVEHIISAATGRPWSVKLNSADAAVGRT